LRDLLGHGAILVRTDVELAPDPLTEVGPPSEGARLSTAAPPQPDLHALAAPAVPALIGPTPTVNVWESLPHEERNVDQCAPARGMPDRHR
jgi:hypothetical protein